MNKSNNPEGKNNSLDKKKYPVQQVAIEGNKVTQEEVEEAVQEINIDENTTERG